MKETRVIGNVLESGKRISARNMGLYTSIRGNFGARGRKHCFPCSLTSEVPQSALHHKTCYKHVVYIFRFTQQTCRCHWCDALIHYC
jgi:hypothetical protein